MVIYANQSHTMREVAAEAHSRTIKLMKREEMQQAQKQFFDLNELASQLPASSEDMLEDIRIINASSASCRLVRMYKQLPLHFHSTSDENVYVFQGRALFQLGAERREISAGMFIQFPRETPHAVLEILEEPLITLTVDTPNRPEDDITFVNPPSS